MKQILIAATVLSLATSCKKVEAGFTADKYEAYVGEPIHFFDNEERRKNSTFTYDFGDGTNSSNNNSNIYFGGNNGYGSGNNNNIYSDRNPSHIYWQPGTYEVVQTVVVAGNLQKGRSKQASHKLSVTIKPLQCDFSTSTTVATTTTVVQLTNNTPYDVSWAWWSGTNFGWSFSNTTSPAQSGVTATYIGGNSSGTFSKEVYLTFNAPGTWKVTLGGGFCLPITKTIIVN
jgi:hypothetical protein